MKSAFQLSGLGSFCIIVVLSGMLSACGQRGPLYLPKPEASAAPAKAAAAPPDPSAAADPK